MQRLPLLPPLPRPPPHSYKIYNQTVFREAASSFVRPSDSAHTVCRSGCSRRLGQGGGGGAQGGSPASPGLSVLVFPARVSSSPGSVPTAPADPRGNVAVPMDRSIVGKPHRTAGAGMGGAGGVARGWGSLPPSRRPACPPPPWAGSSPRRPLLPVLPLRGAEPGQEGSRLKALPAHGALPGGVLVTKVELSETRGLRSFSTHSGHGDRARRHAASPALTLRGCGAPCPPLPARLTHATRSAGTGLPLEGSSA